MPIKPHPVFKSTAPENGKMWRYMSLPKFLSLIQRRTLFLSNMMELAKTDPFEGSLPVSALEHRNWNSVSDVPEHILSAWRASLHLNAPNLEARLLQHKRMREERIALFHASRVACFVNCWHQNEVESAAMWHVYSQQEQGIAIVSSEHRIRQALQQNREDLYFGAIQYGDYSDRSFLIDDNNAFQRLIYKRSSFSYEQEYRLIFWDHFVSEKRLEVVDGIVEIDGKKIFKGFSSEVSWTGKNVEELANTQHRPGHEISCDIDALINEIFISPSAPSWFTEVVKDICDKYNVKCPIRHSSINSSPLT